MKPILLALLIIFYALALAWGSTLEPQPPRMERGLHASEYFADEFPQAED